MRPRFPTFALTPAETASLEASVVDLLAAGARWLHRPGARPGRHDYAAALRLVRDARAYSGDLLRAAHEEGAGRPREAAYAASCALLQGDALRGLGRLPEAAAAYRAAAAAYADDDENDGPSAGSRSSRRGDDDDDDDDEARIDRVAARLAVRHLADLGFFSTGPRRRRRAGGLWNAHDVAGARHGADAEERRQGGGREDEDEEAALPRGEGRGRQRGAEYWDPEPALVVRSVARGTPVLTPGDRPAARAAAGAVPAVVVVAPAALGSRHHRWARHQQVPPPTTTRPSTRGGRLDGGGGGSGRLSGNARVPAPPRSQEPQPPRPLRRRKSASHDLKALVLQGQTRVGRHGR